MRQFMSQQGDYILALQNGEQRQSQDELPLPPPTKLTEGGIEVEIIVDEVDRFTGKCVRDLIRDPIQIRKLFSLERGHLQLGWMR